MLSWVGDNATSNDTQNDALGANPNNSFDPVNRVRCFNHTLNLAVKAFLVPFAPPEKKKTGNDKSATSSPDDDDDDTMTDFALEEDDDLPDLADVSFSDGPDQDNDEDISAWDELGDEERVELLKETDSVKVVISNVRPSSISLGPI